MFISTLIDPNFSRSLSLICLKQRKTLENIRAMSDRAIMVKLEQQFQDLILIQVYAPTSTEDRYMEQSRWRNPKSNRFCNNRYKV